MPPPASRVRAMDCTLFHGFADSPVATCRHPLRGFVRWIALCSTGSRTHPWLHADTRFAGSRDGLPLFHGFADSPVATCRHPLRGFARWIATVPRVRGLTRGY